MKINEIISEDVSQGDFAQIERFADALWGRLGVDVKFTWHFMQRVNDERNGKPITTAELIRMFKKEYMKYGKNVANMDNSVEAVFKDAMTAINLPFVIKDTPQGKELIAKTTMRKPNFKTHPGQPTYVIDDVNLDEKVNPATLQQGYHRTKPSRDGKFQLVADGTTLGAVSTTPNVPVLKITAYDDNMIEVASGQFTAERGKLLLNKNLVAHQIWVEPAYRRLGLASEIYQFATELGNTMAPSKYQSDQGKALWKGFAQKGVR
jgi:hypothetical protein